MEWIIFVVTIVVALNVVALINLNIEVSEVRNKLSRLSDLQYSAYTNGNIVYEEVVEIADKLDGHFLQNADIPVIPEITVDADELSQNELARLERKKAFDARINTLREELGYDNYGTYAEEEHPDVKNLPHNIIPTSLYDLPDVEIAE